MPHPASVTVGKFIPCVIYKWREFISLGYNSFHGPIPRAGKNWKSTPNAYESEILPFTLGFDFEFFSCWPLHSTSGVETSPVESKDEGGLDSFYHHPDHRLSLSRLRAGKVDSSKFRISYLLNIPPENGVTKIAVWNFCLNWFNVHLPKREESLLEGSWESFYFWY